MREITEFRIAASHTVNIGNYESLRIEAQVTVTVGEASELDDLKARAQIELRKLLEETYRAQHKKEAQQYARS